MIKNKKFDIIMLNMSDYGDWSEKGIVNRNYFVLHELLKSKNVGKILAIDFLPHNFKRAFKKFFTLLAEKTSQNLIEKNFFNNIKKVEDKLYVYSTAESICTSCEDKMYAKINKIASNLNFENIVLWSYIPTFTKYLDNIQAELKIFDAVDNWSEHANYKKIKDRLLTNYKYIDENSNIIFTVSKELEKLFKNNKNVHWIPNGVDSKHFNTQEEGIIPEDIKGVKKPIVGYVGIVQDRFDVDLLEYLLNNNKDKSFVIVGMVWPDAGIDRLIKYNNLYLLGQKKYQDIPQYLNQFDVVIIPHKINEFTKSMNPMKLYEYLASGKPIISTNIAGSEKFEEFIKIADTREDFDHKLNQALLDDNIENIELRKSIAQENSWTSRVEYMQKIIINNLK